MSSAARDTSGLLALTRLNPMDSGLARRFLVRKNWSVILRIFFSKRETKRLRLRLSKQLHYSKRYSDQTVQSLNLEEMASGKRILVLGATGWLTRRSSMRRHETDSNIGVSGLRFTQLALEQKDGPKLTLYVRSRSKLSANTLSNAAVRVVEGSLTDEQALQDAMIGVDSVVSFLGAYVSLSAFVWRTTTTPIADAFPTIFRAMRAQGVKRILVLSTPAYGVESEQKPWMFWLTGLLPALLVPQGNAEMVAIARHVAAQSDLDWTVFRVPYLNNGPADVPLAAGLLGPDYRGTTELSRASMARWVLEEIKQGEWIHGAPALGNY